MQWRLPRDERLRRSIWVDMNEGRYQGSTCLHPAGSREGSLVQGCSDREGLLRVLGKPSFRLLPLHRGDEALDTSASAAGAGGADAVHDIVPVTVLPRLRFVDERRNRMSRVRRCG